MNKKEKSKPKLLLVGNLAKDIVFGHEKYGGSAALIAITAKKLGLDVGIMSVVGKDEFSKKYISYLNSMEIDTKLVKQLIDTIPTCQIFSSENRISSYIWTDNGCHDVMVNLTISHEMDKYNLIHLVSCSPDLAVSISKHHNNLSYEPGPLLPTNSEYFDPFVASRSKLLFLNEEEHLALINFNKGVTKNNFIYKNISAMIVTLGEKGSNVIQENQSTIIPAMPLKSDAIDPVGAGDNFKAGFLTGYLYGLPLKLCAQIGSQLGAICVQQVGGILLDKDIESVKSEYFHLDFVDSYTV